MTINEELKSNYLRRKVRARKRVENELEENRLRKMIDDDAYFEEIFKEVDTGRSCSSEKKC